MSFPLMLFWDFNAADALKEATVVIITPDTATS
jgi:hypothetical protein